VTKKEIVKDICDRANKQKPPLLKGSLTQLATKEIVQWTFEAIINTLVKEGRIELRNFGVFEVKQRKPRKARNPRTGARVDVEAKNVVTFQPGKEMEEQVKKFAKPAETKKKTRKSKAAKAAPAVPEPSSNGTPAPSADGTGVPVVSAPATTPVAKPAPEPVTSDAPAAT
jgi:integration host factor subunit beta